VKLVAPLDGWSTPLAELPDPVFAERMLGDGLAIDPTSDTLRAPCDGIIAALPHTRHAITLRTRDGLEILLHIGLETVALGGDGFEALVCAGAEVRCGDPLLQFDLDAIARTARSLLTPIVIVSPEFEIVARHENRSVAVGEPVLELRGRSVASAAGTCDESTDGVSRDLTIGLEHGLHARPAARIAHQLRSSQASVILRSGERSADARSVTSLMALGLRQGDRITLVAKGVDAAAVVMAIARQLSEDVRSAAAVVKGRGYDVHAATTGVGSIPGVVANRGIAVGPVVQFEQAEIVVPERGSGITHEAAEFDRARQAVREALAQHAGSQQLMHAELASAHLELLDDPALVAKARDAIALGKSAGFAWRSAVREQAQCLGQVDVEYLRERMVDLLDLEAQVLLAIGHASSAAPRVLPEQAILIARDLLPSQFIALDAAQIGGICLARGGPTSHVSILAAAADLPMLVAAGEAVLELDDGRTVVLEADAGVLRTRPTHDEIASAQSTLKGLRERRAHSLARARAEARMASGERVRVYANLGAAHEAASAVAQGAEGCGLLRTEFLFIDRRTPPDVEVQRESYQTIATALGGRTLTIRTLDVGGDKSVEYLPGIAEQNPALGLRGVRMSFAHREMLRTQLRAILRVRPAGQCRILLPMITDADDVAVVRAELEALLVEEGGAQAVELGAMIETPAAALLSHALARAVDYFSIGTNDLTQYTLAMDRGHPGLAARVDGLHPAVLRLVRATIEGAAAYDREVSVCGNLALDPVALPILLGLGVDAISVVAGTIPAVKEHIRSLDLGACRELARRSLACATAGEVRALERP
jgi:phosphocarrier protein FPr/phosphocarrier protein